NRHRVSDRETKWAPPTPDLAASTSLRTHESNSAAAAPEAANRLPQVSCFVRNLQAGTGYQNLTALRVVRIPNGHVMPGPRNSSGFAGPACAACRRCGFTMEPNDGPTFRFPHHDDLPHGGLGRRQTHRSHPVVRPL